MPPYGRSKMTKMKKTTTTSPSFFSMNTNPGGASVGNLVSNFKEGGQIIKGVGQTIKKSITSAAKNGLGTTPLRKRGKGSRFSR